MGKNHNSQYNILSNHQKTSSIKKNKLVLTTLSKKRVLFFYWINCLYYDRLCFLSGENKI